MPRASSRSSESPRASSSWASVRTSRARQVALELRGDDVQLEGDRDEPLLSAVVQVALEPHPFGVADLDEPRPRRGQLLVGVGIGQSLRDEFGEVAQPLLETVGQASSDVVAAASTPQPSADGDRRRHRGAVAEAPHGLGQGAARLLVVHALGVPLRSTFATTVSPSRSSEAPTGKRGLPSSLQVRRSWRFARRRTA